VDGVAEGIAAGSSHGVRALASVEFSLDYSGGDFHLLGYGVSLTNKPLLEKLARIKAIRENRIPRIVEQLNAQGINCTVEEVFSEAKGGSAGKPHVARVLIRRGYARNFEEVFDRYLGAGSPGDVPKEKISIARAFELIHGAGGIAICAHPKSLERSYSETESFLQELVPQGLSGIEVYAAMHSDDDVCAYLGIAGRLGVIATGGSDFHGDKGEKIGYYENGRQIPQSCADELMKLLGV
jgi:predicted metal-dependent phosphoesterase TrpH